MNYNFNYIYPKIKNNNNKFKNNNNNKFKINNNKIIPLLKFNCLKHSHNNYN